MYTNYFSSIILAAGEGKRMKSNLPKVLHKLNGRPLVEYVVETAKESGADPIIAVVGYKRELVMNCLGDSVQYAVQAEQKGTGHAALMTETLLKDFPGEVMILSGDVPLLRPETIRAMAELHRCEGNTCTLLSCVFDDPAGYGRIIRGVSGEVLAIIEHKDAADEQRTIKEINSGIYLVKPAPMFQSLHTLKNDNEQGEYYLTDIIADFVAKGMRVGGYIVEDPLEIAGVNSIQQLKEMEIEYLKRNSEAPSEI
ncbi:MAG: NTP transferase domain-containing protein [candidate division Zixibacteria bacterium]|nr:NTP transferase domain-containing protein [Candidatus Tariuqbacter arcticus]